MCIFKLGFVAAAANFAGVQFADIGTASPNSGPNDIFQAMTKGDTTFPDGLNCYTGNSVPAGQTCTTNPPLMPFTGTDTNTTTQPVRFYDVLIGPFLP